MQENEPVLLVFSVFGREIIPEKGEILCEKQQLQYGVGNLAECSAQLPHRLFYDTVLSKNTT